MISNFPVVLNFNRLFLKLNRFICNQLPVLPNHRIDLEKLHNLTPKCSSLHIPFSDISNNSVEFFLLCSNIDFVLLKSNCIDVN